MLGGFIIKYNYYFDESFHTRTITEASLKTNDYFNSYISTGIGIKANNVSKIFKRYKDFEEKYKTIYSVCELKSEIINKKHYKYGISTFKKNEVELYYDYFNFMLNNDIQYYISICDKLEYLLLQCKYSTPNFFIIPACVYSLTKLINVYRPKEIIEDIMNKEDKLVNDLKKFLKRQLSINGNIKLKKQENETINSMLLFLNYIDPSKIDYIFNYNFTYDRLKKLSKELNLNEIKVIIDKESTGRICQCAKKTGFVDSRQIDSKRSPGVRMSDMFCGFISRMMRAIYDNTKNNPEIPYTEKHMLSENWFVVDEFRFELYKIVAKYLKKYINVYYASYVGIYFDLFDEFIGLIYYFDDFNSFIDYNKKSTKEHCERCNNIILFRIYNDLKRFQY